MHVGNCANQGNFNSCNLVAVNPRGHLDDMAKAAMLFPDKFTFTGNSQQFELFRGFARRA